MTEPGSECEGSLPELRAGARTLKIPLSSQQEEQLVLYCRLLEEANRRINLTAVRTASGIMRTLFLDSLTVVIALPPSLLADQGPAPRVVDVGSGSGVPGLPLKIAYPHWQVTLVESIKKKARALEEIVAGLGLSGVQVLAERAEILGQDTDHRDQYDLCLARAVAPLPSLVELCAPLVRPGGLLALPRGANASVGVRDAVPAARALKLEHVELVRVPPELGLGEDRSIAVYQKIAPTPPGYPRRVGLAQSRPIGPAKGD